MTWRRASLLVATALGVAIVLGVATGAWVLATESGTAWTLRYATARAPGMAFGRVHGSLIGGVVMEDVHVRLPRDELDIAELALDWEPGAVYAGTLAFKRVAATSIAYRRVAADVPDSPPLQLPFDVRADAVTIAALAIDVGGGQLALGATEAAVSLRGSRLLVERIETTTGEFTLAGNATVDVSAALSLTAYARWAGPIGGAPAAGAATLAGTWPTLRVQHELTAPFASRAEGTVDFEQEPRADLAIEWRDLAWPGLAGLASPSGRLTLAGTVGDYRYDGTATLAIDARPANVVVRGTGNRAQLALERVELDARSGDASDGLVTVRGNADLAAQTVSLEVAATDANPRWWDGSWPGRLRATGGMRASLAPLSVAFDALEISGALRGYPLKVRGSAQYTAPDRWRLAGVRLTSGVNRVAVDGVLTAGRLELVADADVANLDVLWPGLRGAVAGKVALGGTFDAPTGRGRLVARSVAFRDFALEQATIEGELGATPAAPLRLRLEAQGAASGPIRVEKVLGTAEGTTVAHRVTLDLAAREWRAHAAGDGAVAARTWRGTLAQAEFDEDRLGRWQLVAPAAVAVGPREVSLATACLDHTSGGRWCGELDVRGKPGDRVALAAQNFDLETLRPLLPPALSLEGVYQLSASLFDVTGNPRGALVLTGEHTRVRATTGEQQTYAMDVDELRAAVTLGNGRLELLGALRSGDAGKLDLQASIRDVRMTNSPIDGTLSAAWPDIGFLALLAPELAQLGGNVTSELAVRGTVDEPEVDGRAVWQGGRVAVPQWGLVVDGIEASATSDGGRALAFNATGSAGDNQVTLTGQTELDPQAHWPTRLHLRGDTVRAVRLPEAEIYVTPDLAAVVAWPDVRVTGTVKVPRASLGLSTLPAQAVAPSGDALVHGREGAPDARRLQLHAAVDMALGDDVRYSGLDLDTKVTGALHLDAEPNRSPIATGALTLTGTYNAYGQKLTLERGQLVFSGPLDDPGVDVRAVRVIDTTRVGVELAGTVKSPRTRMYSTPAMNDADALSYLLFGRPVTGTGTQEAATLQTAAIAMGLNQALPAFQRVGATLGLDELSVQTTTTDAGALMAGKYLSPKLYIRYSYGLFNRMGGLLLRFKFNERLSIETRSGDQKSMDLLYTVEKD